MSGAVLSLTDPAFMRGSRRLETTPARRGGVGPGSGACPRRFPRIAGSERVQGFALAGAMLRKFLGLSPPAAPLPRGVAGLSTEKPTRGRSLFIPYPYLVIGIESPPRVRGKPGRLVLTVRLWFANATPLRPLRPALRRPEWVCVTSAVSHFGCCAPAERAKSGLGPVCPRVEWLVSGVYVSHSASPFASETFADS